MALTQGAWSTKSTDNGFLVHTCQVTATTAESDAYTLRTPKSLDPEKQWILYLTFDGTPDAQALPVDLWYGFSEDFALSGDDSSVVATDGAQHKQILDDCVTAVNGVYLTWVMDPYTTVTDDVTYNAGASANVKPPIAPYYAFNLDGGSTLAAKTATWKIVQKV